MLVLIVSSRGTQQNTGGFEKDKENRRGVQSRLTEDGS